MEKEHLIHEAVGAIVARNFSSATVFARYGIDFCCHGDTPLGEACAAAGVTADEVIKALNIPTTETISQHAEFSSWPVDLLIDYVLKIHHRGIRKNGPAILELLEKVVSVHGEAHPELYEIRDLFAESLQELDMHLVKEEEVLFPYLLELFEASENKAPIAQMHCGTVENPIRVMRMEHEGEGNRYLYMAKLTNNYTAPENACNSYRLVYEQLHGFMNGLFEHIHLENNIIFPIAVELENQWVR